MNRKEKIPVIIVSIYLLVISIYSGLGIASPLGGYLLAIGPVLLIWVVYNVIRHGKYEGKELDPGEEWGYADKKKEELGIF
jgi:hypothetical protein